MKHLMRTVLRHYFRGRLTLLFTLLSLMSGIAIGVFAFPRRIISGVQTYLHPVFTYLIAVPMLLTVAGTVLKASGVCADGVVRNQCISGFTKSQIYCCHVLGAGIWGLINGLLTVVPLYFIGQAFFLRCLEGQTLKLLFPMLLGFPLCAVLAAALALSVQQRALSVIFCVAVSFVLYFGGGRTMMLLDEPKYRSTFVWQDNEEKEVLSKNPDYIKPPKRQIVEFLYLLDPIAPALENGWYFSDISEAEYFSNTYEQYLQTLPEHEKEVRRTHSARRRTFIWFQMTMLLIVTAGGTVLYRKRGLS